MRANAPSSISPRPFLRWAGSKRLLLTHLAEFIPPKFDRYFEPFLGSGSLFFLLSPRQATLSDSCSELIDTFCAVRSGAPAILKYLNSMDLNPDEFYRIRSNRSSDRLKRAAEFIYLNRGCSTVFTE